MLVTTVRLLLVRSLYAHLTNKIVARHNLTAALRLVDACTAPKELVPVVNAPVMTSVMMLVVRKGLGQMVIP